MAAAQPPPLMFRVGPHRNGYFYDAAAQNEDGHAIIWQCRRGEDGGDPTEFLWGFHTDLVTDHGRQSAVQGFKWLACRAPVPDNPEDMRELPNQATFVFATPEDSIFEDMGHRWIRWTDWRGHEWAVAADVPDDAGPWMHFKVHEGGPENERD